MRAKFRVDDIDGSNEIIEGTDELQGFSVKMSAVTSVGSDENADFNKYTPSGIFEMYVDNPKAKGFFELNEEYYLDFTKA
jgi:hypothetical protein